MSDETDMPREYDDHVVVSEEARELLEAPATPGPRAFWLWKLRCKVHYIDRAQDQGVHEVLWIQSGGPATCSCGLRFGQPDEEPSYLTIHQTPGHRVLPSLDGPEWVVVTGNTANIHQLDCTVLCQRCGWNGHPPTWEAAEQQRRQHRATSCTAIVETDQ